MPYANGTDANSVDQRASESFEPEPHTYPTKEMEDVGSRRPSFER